eukprot:4328852-Heterocapsa_arctica.AAC.1
MELTLWLQLAFRHFCPQHTGARVLPHNMPTAVPCQSRGHDTNFQEPVSSISTCCPVGPCASTTSDATSFSVMPPHGGLGCDGPGRALNANVQPAYEANGQDTEQEL